jgi:alkanesulfonate monooxygenase SsuD/methylene tetrahydromethanopterin reductase-like flavin-dependent oxidoreductase (luciferase family)
VVNASFCVPPPSSFAQTALLAQQAEAAGMRALWLYDVPWELPDPYPHIAVALASTTRLAVGPLVSTPAVRPSRLLAPLAATLSAAAPGRFELALGRGDAAVRSMGCSPAALADLVEASQAARAGHGPGEPGAIGGRLWAPPPIWWGTYGPRGLELAGEHADGVILQFADVELVHWACSLVERGAKRAGRSLHDVRVMVVCAASFGRVGESAVDACRWFVDMVARDLRAMAAKPAAAPWSAELRAALAASSSAASLGAEEEHAWQSLAQRLCLIGPPAEVGERLRLLEAAGVTEVAVYSAADATRCLDAWSAALSHSPR